MKKLNDSRGLSTTEVLCISFLSIVAAVLLVTGILWYRNQQCMADDSLLVVNARSMGEINSINGGCPVNDCGGGDCVHKTADAYVGYFDHPTNKIYGEKRSGYNESRTMEIDEKKYTGEPGTKVIRVEFRDGELSLSWVEGDNR